MKPRFELTDRQKMVLALRAEGGTFGKIGHILGVCSGRAAQIYKNAIWRKKQIEDLANNPDSMFGLSCRAANILYNNDIKTRPQVVAALETGRLAFPEWKKVRNLGKKTYKEICKWVGKTPVLSVKQRTCPHCGKSW